MSTAHGWHARKAVVACGGRHYHAAVLQREIINGHTGRHEPRDPQDPAPGHPSDSISGGRIVFSGDAMHRRMFALGAVYSLGAVSLPAFSQDYPVRPIKLVVPFAAGSSPDTGMRIFGHEMGEVLGQSLIIENRPGANGISGTISALAAPADGYTLIYVNAGTIAINPYLFPKQKYDPLKDLIVLGINSYTPNILVTRPTLNVKSVAELVAYGKANPGKLSMGSSGTGTTGHLSGELFKEMSGIDAVHVPYKGSAAAYTDLIAGRIDFMFDNIISLNNQDRDGRVRLLAVTTTRRVDLRPEVPTMQEQGFKGYDMASWGAVAVARNTPAPVVQNLKAAFEKIKSSPSNQAYYKQAGSIIAPSMTAAQVDAFMREEQKKWAGLVAKSGAANE
ncbi:tripartite tricarboxylate transporter substrate binding protein [Xylophilus sp. Kf1]|nr:tripartite tricarboxylate transporter substrate binding protein [Xylophilus sp. Kf1]